MSDDYEASENSSAGAEGAGTPTALVGAVALAIGAVVGILIGFVGGSSSTTPEPEPEPVAEERIEDEAVEDEDPDALGAAQERVAELEREVAERQREVSELQAEMAKRADRGAEIAGQLKTLKTQLANAKGELKKAVREKDSLLKELRLTEAELEQAQIQRELAREDALFNRWQDFVKGAQLEICDRGNRKKLGRCREAVTATMMTDERRDQFAHCVRSGQAAPVVMELERDAAMPDFSEMIDEAQRTTRGWMIVYCDPTLPEKPLGRLAERHLPGAKVQPQPEPTAVVPALLPDAAAADADPL